MDRIRRYSELKNLKTFEERFEYLKLNSSIGHETFGFDRIFNQQFYRNSKEWKDVRQKVIARDLACDLGIEGHDIPLFNGKPAVKIHIHHMNPITLEDLKKGSSFLLDPEYLITTTEQTHKAIHYGSFETTGSQIIERTKNDTCPWRKD